ncbi:MAG: hypothetical protein OEO84_00255 [Betaproteobacteria bacterium]|nr:hypothetical protein [Betaproteobacteria bacterium]
MANWPLPQGYRLEQLRRADVPELIGCVKEWYPDIIVGAVGCYLQEDFYLRQVFLEGESEKEVMVILLRKDPELAGMLSLERDQHNLTLYCGLGVLAPKHRGAKLANLAPLALETMGRALGMEVIYYITTLRSPHMQAVAETAGFRLVGILPGSDRAMVAPGVVKRVYEAVYIKVLVPEAELLRPKPEYLTPKTKVLFDVLFPE